MVDSQIKIYELVKNTKNIILVVTGPPGSGKSKAIENICEDMKTMCVAYTNELVKNLQGHMNYTLNKEFFLKLFPKKSGLDIYDVLKLKKIKEL